MFTSHTIASLLLLATPASAFLFGTQTFRTTITFSNVAPMNGVCLSPPWFGIHDGNFDLYDRGEPLPSFMELLVEEGGTGDVSATFVAFSDTTVDGTVPATGGGPICPGASGSMTIEHEVSDELFFSYASMVLPSNDAFIANGDPQAFEIFNGFSAPLGASFVVPGSAVLDAGTEDNTETTAEAVGFPMVMPTPGAGTDTVGGVVATHPGFDSGGEILTGTDGGDAARDFTVDDYMVLSVEVESELIDAGFFARIYFAILDIFF